MLQIKAVDLKFKLMRKLSSSSKSLHLSIVESILLTSHCNKSNIKWNSQPQFFLYMSSCCPHTLYIHRCTHIVHTLTDRPILFCTQEVLYLFPVENLKLKFYKIYISFLQEIRKRNLKKNKIELFL